MRRSRSLRASRELGTFPRRRGPTLDLDERSRRTEQDGEGNAHGAALPVLLDDPGERRAAGRLDRGRSRDDDRGDGRQNGDTRRPDQARRSGTSQQRRGRRSTPSFSTAILYLVRRPDGALEAAGQSWTRLARPAGRVGTAPPPSGPPRVPARSGVARQACADGDPPSAPHLRTPNLFGSNDQLVPRIQRKDLQPRPLAAGGWPDRDPFTLHAPHSFASFLASRSRLLSRAV